MEKQEHRNLVDIDRMVGRFGELDDFALRCLYQVLGDCADRMYSAYYDLDSKPGDIFASFSERLYEAQTKVFDEAARRLEAGASEKPAHLREVVLSYMVKLEYPDDDLIITIIETSRKMESLGVLS